MKYKTILSVLLLMIILSISCRNNHLKTNEKKLADEISVKEKEKEKQESERLAQENLDQDTLSNIRSGFQYKEDRSVDPAHPPVVIDFSIDIPVKEFKLSNIASKISYMVLQVPDDSVFFSRGSLLHFTNNNIIVNNNMGINRFSADGRFIETICKSWFNAPRMSYDFPRESFRGVWNSQVYTTGNTAYYKYSDSFEEKVSLLRFHLNNTQPLISIQPKEGQSDTYAKGEVIVTDKMKPGSISPGLASTNIFAVSDNVFAGMPSNRPDAFGRNSFKMVTFNNKGDTLCKFKQFDFLNTPVTSSLMRTFSNISWFYGKAASFKWAFNDTIFRLQPPNRLIPVFVFNFGNNKTSVDDWLHINRSLSGKILIENILESSQFLFIDYMYYSPDNPKLANRGKAIFNKKTMEFFRLAQNIEQQKKLNNPPPPPPRPGTFAPPPQQGIGTPGLENDLDGGLAFWPQYITPEGKLAITIQSETLVNYIRSSGFKGDKKNGLTELVRSLKGGGREIVIMITE